MFSVSLKDISREDFLITEYKIAKEPCYFVKPNGITTTWTNSNLHFRSSIYNSDGVLISASYPKFFNLEEKPDITPFNGDLAGTSLIEKIDGSTLIVSLYKDELILRTRRTLDVKEKMANGDELELFKKQYKEFFDYLKGMPWTCYPSYIFEWVSPANQIVLKYEKPELYLTNIISHKDYSLANQNDIDKFAKTFNFKRPERFQFKDMNDLLASVKAFEGKEGICLYFNNDQNIRKVKGTLYLKLHSFKSQCNLKTLLKLYEQWIYPSKFGYEALIQTNFDYECKVGAQPLIDVLYQAVTKAEAYLMEADEVTQTNAALSQKDFAFKVKEHYKDLPIMTSVCFGIRKGAARSKFQIPLLEKFLLE